MRTLSVALISKPRPIIISDLEQEMMKERMR